MPARVDIVGRLGKDPEERLAKGKRVLFFPVASRRRSKSREVDWFWVSVYQSSMQKVVQEFLRKGSMVSIQGIITGIRNFGTAGAGANVLASSIGLIGEPSFQDKLEDCPF